MTSLKEQFLGFCNTKPLFNNIYDLNQFQLEDIDIDKIDFNDLEITQQMPLGRRVEIFFAFYMKHSSQYNLITNNIQIINNGHTLGEIDFLFEEKDKKSKLHVELVYKYYLYDESFENEIDRYIGPNRDDTFLKKLKKLKNKQLPLLFKDETKEYFEDINPDNTVQKVCLRANIFIPRHLKDKKFDLINNAAIEGFYISYKDFVVSEEYKKYEYCLPHRYDWVSAVDENSTWEKHDEIQEEIEFFLNLKKSPLVWLKKEDSYERLFVTWW